MDTIHETLSGYLAECMKDKQLGLGVTKYSRLLLADCICFFKDK